MNNRTELDDALSRVYSGEYPDMSDAAVIAEALRAAQPFNNLTPEEAERLAMLSEECAEVIQIVGKILRHGYDSYHPNNPNVSNRQHLEEEIMDVHAVVQMMKVRGDVEAPDVGAYMAGRIGRKLRYSHHQRNDDGA